MTRLRWQLPIVWGSADAPFVSCSDPKGRKARARRNTAANYRRRWNLSCCGASYFQMASAVSRFSSLSGMPSKGIFCPGLIPLARGFLFPRSLRDHLAGHLGELRAQARELALERLAGGLDLGRVARQVERVQASGRLLGCGRREVAQHAAQRVHRVG